MVQPRRRHGAADHRRHARQRNQVPHDRLPVTELLFDRPGAASPFGDDQTFPLPPGTLSYVHPDGS